MSSPSIRVDEPVDGFVDFDGTDEEVLALALASPMGNVADLRHATGDVLDLRDFLGNRSLCALLQLGGGKKARDQGEVPLWEVAFTLLLRNRDHTTSSKRERELYELRTNVIRTVRDFPERSRGQLVEAILALVALCPRDENPLYPVLDFVSKLIEQSPPKRKASTR